MCEHRVAYARLDRGGCGEYGTRSPSRTGGVALRTEVSPRGGDTKSEMRMSTLPFTVYAIRRLYRFTFTVRLPFTLPLPFATVRVEKADVDVR